MHSALSSCIKNVLLVLSEGEAEGNLSLPHRVGCAPCPSACLLMVAQQYYCHSAHIQKSEVETLESMTRTGATLPYYTSVRPLLLNGCVLHLPDRGGYTLAQVCFVIQQQRCTTFEYKFEAA